jgi:nucleolar protein 56
MYLITKWFGTFIFDKKRLKKEILFPKNEKDIAKRFQKMKKNEILAEEKKISKGVKEIVVNEKRLQKIGKYNPSDKNFKIIELKPEKYGFKFELLKRATIINSKKIINEKLSSKDLDIIQMVNTLDDLIQVSNLLSERFDCWNMLSFTSENIEPLKKVLLSVKNEMEILENQIEYEMNKFAPNISKLIGPMIGARLISLSGSLEKLALLPSSTIQILGAEKALFRFKKEGGKPPKHGVIFQLSYINKSPKEIRGKIARTLSAKISIAAKADAFTKRNISEELKEDLTLRINDIRHN